MKKMQAAVILTAATVTLALDNVASAAVECEADHQCDSGNCYLETGRCVPCIDCGSYLRESSPWRTCARGPQDCGECLTGFEYEYLTDGTTRNFCVRLREIENGIWNERSPYLWIVVASVVGIIAVFIYIILRCYRGAKTRSGVHNNSDVEDPPPLSTDNDNELPPPSYDSSVPLLRQSGVSSALVTSLTVVEKGENSLQQAVPFTNPHPPYGIGGLIELQNEVQDPVPEDPYFSDGSVVDSGDENERPRTISPPQLEEEDTMPSDWMPLRESTHAPEESTSEHCEEHSSVSSSLSDISNRDVADVPANAQEVSNDSGVSASCSHQSDLSFAHGMEGLEVLTNGQEATANGIHTVLQRRHSDEDLSTLSERKRQRRDSGSSSMKSVETYREKV